MSMRTIIFNFSHYIRESKHETKFLTDSKACVQAFEKLSKGGFSLSPRISSYLMNLNALNISINHTSGSSIPLTDFSSRNPISCVEQSCQVCRFVNEHIDLAVRSVSVSDIESGIFNMPFYNPAAWRGVQKDDTDLKRCFSQLHQGTRPGKKEKNLKLVRRYLQVASISNAGILIHRKSNPYGKDFELIIVPEKLTVGLITALHLRLGHPTKTQFRKIWDRYYFALNAEKVIDDVTHSCSLCNSMKTLPKELIKQSTSAVPDTVGRSFSADVIRRENQKIFVLLDIFSSFVVGKLLANEQHQTLREALIQLSVNYKHPDGCIIRVDNAPGFQALRDDKLLAGLGITLDFGRIKNKNQNPCVDRAIQDIEKEIKRLAPNGGQISTATLAIAISNMNNRIRSNGLSSKEVLMKRDCFTNNSLDFDDKQLSDFKYTKRLQNHPYSEQSKSKGNSMAPTTIISVGDMVHIKSDGSKHRTRDFYLVVTVNYDSNEAHLQKFCGNQLRTKRYVVKLSEIYLASSNFIFSNGNADDNPDGISLNNNGESDDDVDSPPISSTPPISSSRYPMRDRRQPDWLATNEIERSRFS